MTAAGGRSVVALQAAPAKPADSAASSVGEPAAPAERPEPSAAEEQEVEEVDDSDSRPQIEHTWIFRYDSADAQRAGVTYVRSSPTGPPSTA